MGKRQQKDRQASGTPKGARIQCLKCKTYNPPDRMFCGNCGAKLPLAKDPFADVPRSSRIKPVLKQIPRVLLLLLLITIALILWPPAYIGMEGDSRNEEMFEEKMRKLHQAVEAERETTIVINETGINAFLEKRVKQYLEQHRFDKGTVLKSVRMMVTPGSVRVQVKSDHGPLTLTREVEGVPRVEQNKFVFDVESVTLGILPLPSPLSSIVAERIGMVFARLEDEREVIESVTRIKTAEGKLRLTVGDGGN